MYVITETDDSGLTSDSFINVYGPFMNKKDADKECKRLEKKSLMALGHDDMIFGVHEVKDSSNYNPLEEEKSRKMADIP